DTIPVSDKVKKCDRIRVLGMAGLMAESIRRVSNEESISAMFENA
ncbi:MAG: ribose-phosphate pyrophosphokinase, partial [Gammaproteobacteria bacterium]